MLILEFLTRLEDGQHFFSKKLETPLSNVIWRPAEAEGTFTSNSPKQFPALFQASQILSGVPQLAAFKTIDGTAQTGLPAISAFC